MEAENTSGGSSADTSTPDAPADVEARVGTIMATETEQPPGAEPETMAGPGVPDASGSAAEVLGHQGEIEEEPMCRYCFEGVEAGELISPCSCTGGQKWVHVACLRRWQRMVISLPIALNDHDCASQYALFSLLRGIE